MSQAALEVIVTAYAGEPVPVPVVGRLEQHSELTIGRNPGNALVLDDPARQVSRFQATMVAAGSGARLGNVSNQSSVLVNGAEIRPGETADIAIGDQIVMGRFLLELRIPETPIKQPQPNHAPLASRTAEPAADTPPSPPQPSLPIPDDYDVFASPDNEQDAADVQITSLDDFTRGQSHALLEGLDSITDEPTPLDQTPPPADGILGLVEEKLDPLQLFGAAASRAPTQTLALDHTPEMQAFIRLPSSEQAPAHLPEEEAPSAAPPGVLELAPDSTPEPVSPAPQAARTGESSPVSTNLREALAQGCGLPEEALPELTPALMQELGSILRAMTSGTVRLMHSRSMTKHEMRANVTIIASAGNNPIKFAPDGSAALQQMLGRQFSGFMKPIEAIEDAFDDLSAHQLGLLAGARRAALELIEQLDPERTSADYEPSGMLEGLLPSLREARLWRRHQRHYRRVAEDQEGLARLIERSFVKSYEEEIERIYTGRGQ